VLTATFNSYGDRQISPPPTKSIPLNRSTKKFGTIDYVRDGTSYTKFGRNLYIGGFWANGWNITKIILFLFIYTFFWSAYRSDPWMDFLPTIAQKTWNHARMCILGVWTMCSQLLGYNPKNWNFWCVNRTFKPERQKIHILTTWKLLSQSWRNFYREYAPRMRLLGWSHGSTNQIQDGSSRHL